MQDIITPSCKCPRCGYEFDRASGAFGNFVPRTGDLTACLKCGLVMVFNSDLTVHIASDQEMQSLTPGERRQVNILVRTIRDLGAKRN